MFTSRILCFIAASVILSLGSLTTEHRGIWPKPIRTENHKTEMGEESVYATFYNKNCLTVIFYGRLEEIGKFNSNDHIMIVLSRDDKTKRVLFIPKANADLTKEYMIFVISTDLFYKLCEYFDTMHWWHD